MAIHVPAPEQEKEHIEWMRVALEQVRGFRCWGYATQFTHPRKAEEALNADEVPVGCVFVRDGQILASARNRTYEHRNVS